MITGSGGPSRLGYVPALDGVRGLAVLVVMGFHISKNHFPGGWLGVDTFFVLSGFLITTLLLEERSATGGIALQAFWLRRALRLIPAMALMLAATVAYALLCAPPEVGRRILTEIAPSALYVYNLPVFDKEPTFLYHMWSLGQEEQFYLLWPPALVLSLRLFAPARLFVVLVSLILAAFVVRWLPSLEVPLHHRPETLLVGCALAIARRTWASPGHSSLLVFPFGFVLLVLVAVPYKDVLSDPQPLIYPLVSLSAGAVLLGLVAERDSLPARALSWPPLVFMGKLSYSLYLWHLPVFKGVAVSVTRTTAPNLLVKLTFSFVLAWLTYVFVEKPLQARREQARPSPAPDPRS